MRSALRSSSASSRRNRLARRFSLLALSLWVKLAYMIPRSHEDHGNMEIIEDLNQIDAIAKQVATATLGSQNVKSVHSSQTLDSMGRDALQVVITFMPGSLSLVTGKTATTLMYELNKKLLEMGEDRFPIVRWAE